MGAEKSRWRIDVSRSDWVSVGGPDYDELEGEYRVIDEVTGQTVLTFQESGEWPYMCPAAPGSNAERSRHHGGLGVAVVMGCCCDMSTM